MYPNTKPPIDCCKNNSKVLEMVMDDGLSDSLTNVINNIIAPPSLNSDSPAIMFLKLFGAFKCFNISKTAIGSVGDTTAPKSTVYKLN